LLTPAGTSREGLALKNEEGLKVIEQCSYCERERGVSVSSGKGGKNERKKIDVGRKGREKGEETHRHDGPVLRTGQVSGTELRPDDDVLVGDRRALLHPELERVLGSEGGLRRELAGGEELSIDVRRDPDTFFGKGCSPGNKGVIGGEEGAVVLAHDLWMKKKSQRQGRRRRAERQ
jgi:hypothetical protein